MQVTEELRQFWNKYSEPGDGIKIGKLAKRDHSTVYRVLSGSYDKASTDLIKVINRFYQKRKKAVEKELQVAIDQD